MLPVEEATPYGCSLPKTWINFNSCFPWGKRRYLLSALVRWVRFQSTLPVGEATYWTLPISWKSLNFNPRFPWGKRPSFLAISSRTQRFQSTLPVGEATIEIVRFNQRMAISIHASRGGSDKAEDETRAMNDDISIHASRGGSDTFVRMAAPPRCLFQSTLPVGEATPWFSFRRTGLRFQSTLPVGEATINAADESESVNISIHASRGGSDFYLSPLP